MIDSLNMYSVLFNPNPKITSVQLANGRLVLVVDDALDRPERLVNIARDFGPDFVHATGSAFPGHQLLMADKFSAQLDDFFRVHIRRLLNGRRSLHMYSRLSRVILAPGVLDACQRICHRDSAGIDPMHTISASVLYLFRDPSLGGTVFFEPCGTRSEADALVHDASTLPAPDFEVKYGWRAEYMTESNQYFKVIGRIPALWNRIIFYDGSIFHSSDIAHPEKLNDPEGPGRLTVNGFFTCTRRAT